MKTAKQVILDTGNPQMSGIKVYRVGKKLVRTSKKEWREVIYTRRGQRVQIREKVLFIGWNGWLEQNVTYFYQESYTYQILRFI